MGIANTLPLLDSEINLISSYVGSPWSVVGSCANGTDIANMEDVSDDMIFIMTHGRYDTRYLTICQKLFDGRYEMQPPP